MKKYDYLTHEENLDKLRARVREANREADPDWSCSEDCETCENHIKSSCGFMPEEYNENLEEAL